MSKQTVSEIATVSTMFSITAAAILARTLMFI